MNPVKRIEIAVRTALVRWMSHWARRSRPLDETVDLAHASILLVRQDRIGDVLISTPLVAALARHYPGAAIDFFLSRNNAFVLENDPRVRKRCDHLMIDMIVIALCGVICGCDNWQQIEAFGQRREDWLRRFLRLPNGIPSHDTFERLFQRLDPLAIRARSPH